MGSEVCRRDRGRATRAAARGLRLRGSTVTLPAPAAEQCAYARTPAPDAADAGGTRHGGVATAAAASSCGGLASVRGGRFSPVGPRRTPAAPDPAEPQQLADAVAAMGLSYAVITVVNRDDLPDGGAAHYRACLDAVHARLPDVGLELLCSDLAGNEAALAALLDGAPLQVFAHNVETVERLTPEVRDPRASFAQSLRILAAAKELRPELVTKSSIMLGLGETEAEIHDAFSALRDVGVELLTLGQYLAPGPGYHPVRVFVTPARFDALARTARELGFRSLASGPLVRLP